MSLFSKLLGKSSDLMLVWEFVQLASKDGRHEYAVGKLVKRGMPQKDAERIVTAIDDLLKFFRK